MFPCLITVDVLALLSARSYFSSWCRQNPCGHILYPPLLYKSNRPATCNLLILNAIHRTFAVSSCRFDTPGVAIAPHYRRCELASTPEDSAAYASSVPESSWHEPCLQADVGMAR